MNLVLPKIAEAIATDIRTKIVRGTLEPGSHLPFESELTKVYGVSRPTVRAALRILESEGLVRVQRGGRYGPIVLAPDINPASQRVGLLLQYAGVTITDVWDAWISLECIAIETLARDPRKFDFTCLQSLAADVTGKIDLPLEFSAAGLDFGEEMVRLAGNQTLLFVFRMLRHIIVMQIQAMTVDGDSTEMRVMRSMEATLCTDIVRMVSSGDLEAVALWEKRTSEISRTILDKFGESKIVDVISQMV